MSVTAREVQAVARLARLRVDDSALPTLVDQLSGILAHMAVLQQVEITAADEAVAEESMPLRAPDALPTMLASPRDAFAPAMRDGFFLVPRLTTHEGQGAAADHGEGAAGATGPAHGGGA